MAAGSLALTRELLGWLRSDPAWDALPVGQRAALHWRASLGTLNAHLSRLNVGDGGAATALQAPVLVLGPWRSGTTVMHELLAAASGLTTPRTWQCMNATTFATLADPQRGSAPIARPMDGLSIHAQSPQEDEFALLTLGADSAYRAFWMPHRIGELHTTLEQSHWLQDEHWLSLWESFLAGVLRSTPHARQPLLLKSPNHSFRLQAILRRFPDTRVVWMLRDGAAVVNSNLKMWRAMFLEHGLTEPQPGALDAFIAHALQACAATLDEAAAALASGRFIVVPQSQLRKDGTAVVRAVHARLRLPGPVDETNLQAALARTATGRDERYGDALLPPEVQAAVAAFDAAQGRALSAHPAW